MQGVLLMGEDRAFFISSFPCTSTNPLASDRILEVGSVACNLKKRLDALGNIRDSIKNAIIANGI